MIVLNTQIINKTNGLYAHKAQENLSELKSIMKHLIIKDVPDKNIAVWASNTSTAKTDASPQTSGGNIWAQTGVYRRNYTASGKKEKSKDICSITLLFFLPQIELREYSGG